MFPFLLRENRLPKASADIFVLVLLLGRGRLIPEVAYCSLLGRGKRLSLCEPTSETKEPVVSD